MTISSNRCFAGVFAKKCWRKYRKGGGGGREHDCFQTTIFPVCVVSVITVRRGSSSLFSRSTVEIIFLCKLPPSLFVVVGAICDKRQIYRFGGERGEGRKANFHPSPSTFMYNTEWPLLGRIVALFIPARLQRLSVDRSRMLKHRTATSQGSEKRKEFKVFFLLLISGKVGRRGANGAGDDLYEMVLRSQVSFPPYFRMSING